MKDHLEKIDGGVYEFETMVAGLLVIAESKTPSDEKAEMMFLHQAFRLMQQELQRHNDAALEAWKAMEKQQPKDGPTLVS